MKLLAFKFWCFLACFLSLSFKSPFWNFENHFPYISHKNYKAFENSWICESLWYLGTSQLNRKDLIDHISICDSLSSCSRNDPLLKRTITSNKIWIVYNNVDWKVFLGKWKISLHLKKKILCIWLNWKDIYYELFHKTEFRQIMLLTEQIKGRWEASGIWPLEGWHLQLKQYLTSHHFTDPAEIGTAWLEYSTTVIILTCIFRIPLQNFLNGKKINSLDAFRNHLNQFITQKTAKFWKDGIIRQLQSWWNVVEPNCTYLGE